MGQNFLQSETVIEQIVESAEVKEGEKLLEIGPGKGDLTKRLLATGNTVVAIEKDSRLIKLLNDKFASEIESGQLKLIEGDIFDFKLDELFSRGEAYKVIANIPYYITGKLLRELFSAVNQAARVVLLLQKEVAERLVAKDKKESLLSLSVKAYGNIEYVASVPRALFRPSPKVDSAIISVGEISRKFFDNDDNSEKRFFRMIKMAFSSKRKKLANNLKPYFGDNPKTEKALNKCGIDPNIRAERVSLGEWKCLLKNN